MIAAKPNAAPLKKFVERREACRNNRHEQAFFSPIVNAMRSGVVLLDREFLECCDDFLGVFGDVYFREYLCDFPLSVY